MPSPRLTWGGHAHAVKLGGNDRAVDRLHARPRVVAAGARGEAAPARLSLWCKMKWQSCVQLRAGARHAVHLSMSAKEQPRLRTSQHAAGARCGCLHTPRLAG